VILDRWLTILITVLLVCVVAITVATTLALTNDEQRERPFPRGPAWATLRASESGEDRLRDALGEKCTFDKMYVILLDSGPEGYEAVSVPGDCEIRRFTIRPEDGELQTDDPLAIGL
jgi:hypothetical protein